MTRFICFLVLLALLAGCGDAVSPRSFLVVVDSSVHETLAPSLNGYVESLQREGFIVEVAPWGPGTPKGLRELLREQVLELGIEGALLVGNLPAAWYEQSGFDDEYETFPIDLYLQDLDAEWIDQDGNGRFDEHSELGLEIYTSRLDGTLEELQEYFARARSYREEGPLVDVSAFVFIDDDGVKTDPSKPLLLERLYSDVEVPQDPEESTLEIYLDRLTGRGAEFVYQWVHASIGFLSFADIDEDGLPVASWLISEQVAALNLKASFINMCNCFAARFTSEGNLAHAYTLRTDYGLAIIGSTKRGNVRNPIPLHANLVAGMRWGEAYKNWFNEVGKYSELWHLGIVLMGDPLLKLSGDQNPSGSRYDEQSALEQVPLPEQANCTARGPIDSFEDYREAHPEFFEE